MNSEKNYLKILSSTVSNIDNKSAYIRMILEGPCDCRLE